ncbi:hypothetical protein SBA5_250096 [Candidatus Sulfotelmatomonas gaucii]|uniref:Uncharacterized protein n=1 Tax=Candidatus Sulfuritelmatomonas gaucii TaxID=2043161 RepID=A0A2N9L9B8_9BACT|nr:hypothetical protein SBA5_250096 [Candidatus Sulfotelmatomonas gaucii]
MRLHYYSLQKKCNGLAHSGSGVPSSHQESIRRSFDSVAAATSLRMTSL